MLTLHVIFSVGWLGVDVVLLTLGITGLVTGSPEDLRAAYLGMDMVAGTLVVPLSLGALVTGVLLAVGTHWGFFRHYWVLAKFLITTLAATLSIFVLRGEVADAAERVSGRPIEQLTPATLGDVSTTVVVGPSVALCMYVTTVVLSVFKPWGRTSWGRSA